MGHVYTYIRTISAHLSTSPPVCLFVLVSRGRDQTRAVTNGKAAKFNCWTTYCRAAPSNYEIHPAIVRDTQNRS